MFFAPHLDIRASFGAQIHAITKFRPEKMYFGFGKHIIIKNVILLHFLSID